MGKIFIDDGHSFDYKNGQFMYRTFTFTTNTLIGRYVDLICLKKFYQSTLSLSLSLSLSLVFSNSDTSGIYESKSWLEKVIVVGITGTPTKALLSCGE